MSQSWLIILTATLLIPSSIRSAHSAEIELSKIQTHCTTGSHTLLPVLPLRLNDSLFAYVAKPEEVAQSRKVKSLIEAKLWEQAIEAFRQSSRWGQDQTIRPLLVGLVQANEAPRASRFVIEQFPPQSKQRAQGISAIAAELTSRNQFSEAIALLRNLPQTSEYLSDGIIPVVRSLTTTNQIQKIPEVMTLVPRGQWTVWTDIGNQVPFEPDQAQEIVGSIEGEYLRSLTLKNIATYWLFENRQNFIKAWTIANGIGDCSVRTEVLLQTLKAMRAAKFNIPNPQQTLGQLESLIMGLADPRLNYQSDVINFQVSLASLNITSGRKPQAMKLLERIQQTLPQFDSPIYRAETLIQLAPQYQLLGNNRVAIQLLDATVTEIQAAYKPKPRSSGAFQLPPLMPSSFWREEILEKVAKQYRSLGQIQKAEAIERTLPQRPTITLPDSFKLPPNRRSTPAPVLLPRS